MIIYKITNIINGKIYIGQTVRSLRKRWTEHKSRAKYNHKGYLYNAIRKYGLKNFKIEELEICKDIAELNKKEEWHIEKYNSIKNGYNIANGGLNCIPNEKTRKKLSKNISKALNKPEIKEKIKQKAIKQWKNVKTRNKLVKNISKGNLKAYSKSFKVYKANEASYISCKKGKYIGIWENQVTCAKDLNIPRTGIYKVLTGKNKYCKGYIFEYIGKNNDK